jgi:hypothetical protein
LIGHAKTSSLAEEVAVSNYGKLLFRRGNYFSLLGVKFISLIRGSICKYRFSDLGEPESWKMGGQLDTSQPDVESKRTTGASASPASTR